MRVRPGKIGIGDEGCVFMDYRYWNWISGSEGSEGSEHSEPLGARDGMLSNLGRVAPQNSSYINLLDCAE